MTDDPLPYTLRYYRQRVQIEEEFDTLAEAVTRARWIADAGEGSFAQVRQGDTVVLTQVDDVAPVSTAQLWNRGPIAFAVTPASTGYSGSLPPVLDSDWAYAITQVSVPGADPPPALTPDTRYETDRPDVQATSQAPGGVSAQLTALAGHVARLQARLDTQEALLLDVTARVTALEGRS